MQMLEFRILAWAENSMDCVRVLVLNQLKERTNQAKLLDWSVMESRKHLNLEHAQVEMECFGDDL